MILVWENRPHNISYVFHKDHASYFQLDMKKEAIMVKDRLTRSRAVEMLKGGECVYDVAAALRLSPRTISSWKKCEKIPRLKAGRKKKIVGRKLRWIVRKMDSGEVSTVTDMVKICKDDGIGDFHRTTIARALRKEGLGSFRKKKPFLSKKHREARLMFALTYKD